MKYIFFLLSASLLLASCTEDFFSQTVKIDPPEYDKQLSFHLLLDQKDSAIRIVVSRNYGILESPESFDDWFVKGATAELYENGQKWLTFTPLSVDSSFVLTAVLTHPLQPGSTYEIRAAHPDFPAVRAVQIMPADFQIDSARVKYNAVPGEFGDRIDLAEVFFQDQPGVKNYYEVKLFKLFYETRYDPQTGEMDTLGVVENAVYVDGYNDPNVQAGFYNGGLISDQFFDGQTYKFQARFDSQSYGTADSSIVVRVRHVTEDYFKWSRSYEANYEVDENPLVEPVSIYHNLENGLGIFSVSNRKDIEIH
ncbi:MAG TPA: DUF4249 domain-containing protein [Saprospiraceae bacterium]|nr:DUF4249 domain-containing protein [Saprospiraceae bacterium]HPI05313.1 DUF4249 domain-containing protein [Saprospiraceae bacterium]